MARLAAELGRWRWWHAIAPPWGTGPSRERFIGSMKSTTFSPMFHRSAINRDKLAAMPFADRTT
jgi:hypothetical protein